MPLMERVYCVAVAFIMTEQVEEWICIKFCIKVKHSFRKTIVMIQKAAAMGNWWLAVSSQGRQRACSRVTSPALFLRNIKSLRWLTFPTAQIWCPVTFASSKTKITFERKRFQNVDDVQKNTMGQLMAIPTKDFAVFWTAEETLGELGEVPKCLLWRGVRCHYPMHNVYCMLYLLQ